MSGSQYTYYVIILGEGGGGRGLGNDYLDYAGGGGGSRIGQKLITYIYTLPNKIGV